jgi:hypothetical protein
MSKRWKVLQACRRVVRRGANPKGLAAVAALKGEPDLLLTLDAFAMCTARTPDRTEADEPDVPDERMEE